MLLELETAGGIRGGEGHGAAGRLGREVWGERGERRVWGSDDPNLSFADETGSVGLDDLFCRAAGEDALQRILVDNPARLYGFGPTGGAA